jgi:hypothetical protein
MGSDALGWLACFAGNVPRDEPLDRADAIATHRPGPPTVINCIH